MKFDLTTLSLFLAAYEEASLAKAAEREHISLSALSRRISDLEYALHGELFVRSYKGVQPTPLAEDLIPSVRRMLTELKQIEEIAQEDYTRASGFISICTTMAGTRRHLPADLRAFTQKYPGIRVELREDLSKNVAMAVRSGAADIGFLFENVELEGLECLPYRDDPLVVLVPAGHALAARRSVRFQDILEYEMIAPLRGSVLEDLILAAYDANQVEFRPKIRVGSNDSLCQMVHEHLGIAIVPLQYLATRPGEVNVQSVALDEAWATRRLMACVRSTAQLTRAARLFLDFVTQRSSGTPTAQNPA